MKEEKYNNSVNKQKKSATRCYKNYCLITLHYSIETQARRNCTLSNFLNLRFYFAKNTASDNEKAKEKNASTTLKGDQSNFGSYFYFSEGRLQ